MSGCGLGSWVINHLLRGCCDLGVRDRYARPTGYTFFILSFFYLLHSLPPSLSYFRSLQVLLHSACSLAPVLRAALVHGFRVLMLRGTCVPLHRMETVTPRKHVSKYKNMLKWIVEFLGKFENRGTKINRVHSILITKFINLQLLNKLIINLLIYQFCAQSIYREIYGIT